MLQASGYEKTQIFGNICQTHHIALSSNAGRTSWATQPAEFGRILPVLEHILQPASLQSDTTLSPANACKVWQQLLEDLLTNTSRIGVEEMMKWQYTGRFARSKSLPHPTRGGVIPLTGIPFCEQVMALVHFTDLRSLSWHKTGFCWAASVQHH